MKRSHGAITVVVLLLVYAAFDDITTDRATSFRVEYTALMACVAWLVFVATGLIRQRHLVLGGVSLVAIAAAIWAQRAVDQGQSPGWRPEYTALATAYLWFSMLAIVLMVRGRSGDSSSHDLVDPAVDTTPRVRVQ